MPRATIPEGSARVTMVGTYGPASWNNVFYFLVTPADSEPLSDIVGDLAGYVADFYSAIDFGNLSVDWATSYVNVLYRDPEGSLNRARVADAAAGTNAAGDQDAQVAYLINWSADDPRKGGKARQYIPGVPTNRMADSAHVTPDVQGSITSGLQTWLAAGAEGFGSGPTVLNLVEMSFVDGKADRAIPVPFQIGFGSLNPVVATQRRRVDRLRPT